MGKGIRGHREAIHYLLPHVSKKTSYKLEKKVAFKNHLHFHNVLIKTNLLYLVTGKAG